MKAKLVLGTTFIVLLYLIGSFIAWDMNPANWDAAGRAVGGMFALFGSILIAAKVTT